MEMVFCPVIRQQCQDGCPTERIDYSGDVLCALYIDGCKLLGALDGLEKLGLAVNPRDGEYRYYAFDVSTDCGDEL